MDHKGYLIDTNIVIGLFVNEDKIVNFLNQAARDNIEIRISTMTECEIFSGDISESDHRDITISNNRYTISFISKIAFS